MSREAEEWLNSGRGVPPTLRWSFSTDAPLTDLSLSRETGEVLASDSSGGLYLIGRNGRIQSLIRTRYSILRVAWSDAGVGGVAALNNRTVACFDRKLRLEWTREVEDDVLTVAIDPFCTHAAISTADGGTAILSTENRRVSRFETVRPLRYVRMLTTRAELVAAAEHGVLGRYSIKGEHLWTERMWTNVGDLTATGDGKSVFLAGFAHGIQAFDGKSGKSLGSFVTEGTVSLVSCMYNKRSVVAATLERDLFAIDDGGSSTWYVQAPEDILRIVLSPLGDWMVVGFASGRIIRLDLSR